LAWYFRQPHHTRARRDTPPTPLPAAEKIKELYLWTDPGSALLEGIHIITSNSQKLVGGGGRYLTKATLSLKAKDMATGVLLGISAAMRSDTLLLSAVSFNFLQASYKE
jgi:hypothetical protein